MASLALDNDTLEDLETIQETDLESLWRVLIHNDDVTPMDFVVDILVNLFFVDGPRAIDIMLTAHTMGIAYVTTLPKNEAEKRVGKAHFAASLEGFPLRFSLEPE
ncbi:MAG: ATP-dependent Clp protease adaptor ClpS [Anaerolineales bacterium]|nr:ATP-dependent Clp protease adaptor ClpS [Anaerolineales bacterium]MCB0016991.1 ATP-dependent Clp protease adaptor ClpS [Anaerolineales bacterium]MCB0028783.1 ATP-dependent Clp protease adaptor ClpS [Anaerolineales bacterium]MCB8959522.1 ATP-dependent Clp protease adaptor ClpS [Ardenticatenales bacterium]